MNLQHQFKKSMAKISLLLFVHFILFTCYPTNVFAQENLIITGFQVKTPEFKPYREDGQVSFFLNVDASINVEIQDKNFNLTRSIELMGDGVEGENIIAWDGRDEQGEFIRTGQYIFSIAAQADDGSTGILSKEVEIKLEAPRGTEFKTHVTEIEGEPKKDSYSYINPPEKTVWGEFVEMQGKVFDTIGYGMGVGDGKGNVDHTKKNYLFGCLFSPIAIPFTCLLSPFLSTPDTDHKLIAKLNREIDEDNAEIDAEIAEENKEIDEDNDKVKDSVVIKMTLINN